MGRTVKAARPGGHVALPHRFTPRPYQVPVLTALESGTRYACLVWHRRAGKDTTAFNWLIWAAQQRVGNYYYVFPTMTLGRKTIWEGRNEEGMSFLDHIPPELIVSKNETDMRVVFPNGSAFQIIGSDRYDDMRGPNPVGVIMSEYSRQHPGAWQVLAPIIRQNKGWAVFVYTPLGRNHAAKLYEMAQGNAEWFAERLTVADTGVMSPADIQAERASGMDEALIQQEYYCSFGGSVQGSFYQDEIERAAADGRIGAVPYDPAVPVETAWDIGTTKDATAIWWYQQVGRGVHLIDYHEENNTNLLRLQNLMFHEKRYAYLPGTPHIAPHDIARTEFSTGRTIRDLARDVNLEFRVVPKQNHWERIMAARMLFPRCRFDRGKCEGGLAALAQYHREWDEETRHFSTKEHKDWSNHGADAFGHLAVGIQEPIRTPPVTQAITTWDLFNEPRGWERGAREPVVERAFTPFAG